ncbi:MAG: nitrogen regulation protein, partial [Legionella sp. 21-45-4]
MHEFINSPFHIGALAFPNRLIQGPLAGYTCAPFRQLVYQFTPPAYCCSEMLSAHDLNHQSAEKARRFIYRAPEETRLCYQISGHDPHTLALAAKKLETLGADLIDINCGCPKTKIRKKGAGSALLEKPSQLLSIIDSVRQAIRIPLTVKLRLQ